MIKHRVFWGISVKIVRKVFLESKQGKRKKPIKVVGPRVFEAVYGTAVLRGCGWGLNFGLGVLN